MNDEGNRKRVKMGDDALIGEDNPSPNRIECSVALAPVIESAEDAMDRKRVIADHKERRSRMLAKHMEEVKSFELVCSQDLGPGFSTCNVVKKSREARRRAASAGFCCVCKTELLVMNCADGEDYDEEEHGDRHDNDFEGDVCTYCSTLRRDTVSVKCSICKWTMSCSKKGCKSTFCRDCIAEVEKDGAGAHDLPVRSHPGDPSQTLERGYELHPFVMCDCGICVYCGEDDDRCCKDHEYQQCSCFPGY